VANSASKELTKLRTEVPHYFAKSELYHDALKILYDYRFKLNAHRFIHELFDRVLLNEEALGHFGRAGNKFTPAIIADIQKMNKPDILNILGLEQAREQKGEGKTDSTSSPSLLNQKKAQTLEPKKVIIGFVGFACFDFDFSNKGEERKGKEWKGKVRARFPFCLVGKGLGKVVEGYLRILWENSFHSSIVNNMTQDHL
jgi:hypothetical protein